MNGSFLDFTNNSSIYVKNSSYDSYHPAFFIPCPCPPCFPLINSKHKYQDFRKYDFDSAIKNLCHINWIYSGYSEVNVN